LVSFLAVRWGFCPCCRGRGDRLLLRTIPRLPSGPASLSQRCLDLFRSRENYLRLPESAVSCLFIGARWHSHPFIPSSSCLTVALEPPLLHARRDVPCRRLLADAGQMLHAHLKLVPEDFFDVELSKDNFLVPCLSALLQVGRRTEESHTLETLGLAAWECARARKLVKCLRSVFVLSHTGCRSHGSEMSVVPEGPKSSAQTVVERVAGVSRRHGRLARHNLVT